MIGDGPDDRCLVRRPGDAAVEVIDEKVVATRAIAFRRPAEIADAIVFFAGPKSSYITGQAPSVSGGLTFSG